MGYPLEIDHRVLHRLLGEFCAQLLGAKIRVTDRVISNEDVAAHLTELGDHLRKALKVHDRVPSPTSAVVITAMAMLLHDRAMQISTRPSDEYRTVRSAVQEALGRVVVGQRAAVGNLNLGLNLTSRTLDQLRELAATRRPLLVEGFPPERGIVFTADDRETYRFGTFTPPAHTCGQPAKIREKESVVFTSAMPDGRVTFNGACGCEYAASEPLLDRD